MGIKLLLHRVPKGYLSRLGTGRNLLAFFSPLGLSFFNCNMG